MGNRPLCCYTIHTMNGRPFHRWGIFAGSNFRSTFPITAGWCSPGLPTNVYDRSNPFGPSTFISQFSFAREPTIDTRQSPALSLQSVFNERLNFSPDRGITCVMQFNRNSHCLFYQHTSRAALPPPCSLPLL